MRKRQFTPTVDGRLEERVVLSTVGPSQAYYAPPVVSQRDLNNALDRMHDAFVRAMNDFNRVYREVVSNTHWYRPWWNNGGRYASSYQNWGIQRLQRAAIHVGNQLGADLASAVHGLPYARRDLSPTLRAIGEDVGRQIADYETIWEMKTSGRTAFYPGWVDAKFFVIDAVRDGYYPVSYR